MDVDYQTVKDALERVDGKIPGQPEVTVVLSPPDENGVSEMGLEGPGRYHAEPEGILVAIGIQPAHQIKKYTPTTVAHVVSEPARPPSPRAAAASAKPKGRLPRPKTPTRQPPPKAELVEANIVAKRPRRTRQGGKQ